MVEKRGLVTPAYRLLQRILLAACVVVAPLLMASWFALCPQYGNPGCPTTSDPLAAIRAYHAASAGLLQAFLLVNVFVPYLYSLSYVALGLVAMPRAPWLATLGIMSGWLGSAPWGLVTGQSFLLSDMARSGHDAVATDLLQRFNTHPETLVMATAWIFGHLLGYVLLGLALVRARVVPRWAGYLMVIAAPVMGPLAYGTNQGNLQVLGYLLVFGASVPVGAVLLSPRRTVRPEAEANG